MIPVQERINSLRCFMADEGLQAIFIPGTDPHMSEYLPGKWKVREFITGFTGSFGTVVVTADHTGLWTDTRYFLQAEMELEGSCIQMHKLRVTEAILPEDWMTTTLPAGSRIGIDLSTIPVSVYREMESKFNKTGLFLVPVSDPFDKIWDNRPQLPVNQIFDHAVQFTGLTRKEKSGLICDEIEKKKADFHIITALDELAWTFNLRGNDVPFNPVFTGFGLIGFDLQVLFTDKRKITEHLGKKLISEGVEIKHYSEFVPFLENLENCRILIDPSSTSYAILKAVEKKCSVIESISVISLLKARKNETEIQGFRSAMKKDGVALLKFLYWLKITCGREKITEFTAGRKLFDFRCENEGFAGESFPPIVGYRNHGALVHFIADENNANEIEPDGLLLFDSGGHYPEGTTDITRTVSLGNVSEQQRIDFTLVLKGVIALTTVKFPFGTKGCHLDILARKALWDNGLNYGHGTGHGIGSFLNVHEGPMAIRQEFNPNNIEPGMVLSNEPAIYRENQYGIRIENMMVCVKAEENEFGRFLGFDTLTLCPVDRLLIMPELLTVSEIQWINNYHRKVRDELLPLAPPEIQDYLLDLTGEIIYQQGTVK